VSDAAKILELESQVRKLKASNERLATNFDRVSAEKEELEAKPNSTREMIAELEVAGKAFRKKPDPGENYPGQYRRHGEQDALAAYDSAASNSN